MPFIGNQPAEAFSSFQKQDFTTSATTSYTLDHPVANGNEIALFINFVRQEPTAAYTASGTSLTLTSATSSSDDMYCVYLGKAVQTVNPPNSSVGSSQVSADLITGQTALGATPADTDELLISDAGTLKRVDYSYLKSANTPYFYGELASNQTLTRSTTTKITGMTNDELDSDSAFDGTTFTVPSGKGGKYFLQGILTANYADIGQDGEKTLVQVYKNGASIKNGVFQTSSSVTGTGREITVIANVLANLSASDTIELYGNLTDANGGNAYCMANQTSLMGYKLVE
jgi:hypothetical protein